MWNFKKVISGLFLGLLLCSFCPLLLGDNPVLTISEAQETREAYRNQTPTAIPVLSPEEAQKANEEALTVYKARLKEAKIAKLKIIVKKVVIVSLLIVLLSCIIVFRKQCRVFFFNHYSLVFRKLFLSTRFNRFDIIGIAIVFFITFFFSILVGQKAYREGNMGSWYANGAAPISLSIYNIGEPRGVIAKPGSKLEGFLKKGCKGDLEYSSISNEEAVPQEYTSPTSFLESTGIAWLIALWWKLVGHPDWTTLYILFSILYAFIAVAAYCALRVVTGFVPSVLLCLLLSSYPSMMYQVLFGIRDGIRALFCYISIAILISLLKRGLGWKKTIVCSVALFFICLFSQWIRQDFIVFIPFIVTAAVFFHGKVLQHYKKKLLILSCVVFGVVFAAHMPGIPKDFKNAFGHNIYTGIADYPFMDYLYFSSDNYSKGICVYADRYAQILARSKAYRDRKDLNIQILSEKYDAEIKKELFNLICIYPYDFLRLSLSSSIQNMYIGSRFSERKLLRIDSAPGYWLFQEKSKFFYDNCSSWLYFSLLCITMFLFLGGRFFGNMVLCLAVLMISGCYMFQYDLRHYFYLIIIPLLAFGYIFERIIRILILLQINYKKVLAIFMCKRKTILIHCAVFVCLVASAFAVLFCAKIIQTKQIVREIKSFNSAKTDKLEFKTNIVSQKLDRDYIATEILLPDFFNRTLEQENQKQLYFTVFLKVKFKVKDTETQEKVTVYAKYDNTNEYNILPSTLFHIINDTYTCPIPITFTAGEGLNTLFLPIYFVRDASPFVGIELVAGGKVVEIESVEKILETDKIRSQSAFLIPSQTGEMSYAGNIDWNKVFWGNKR